MMALISLRNSQKIGHSNFSPLMGILDLRKNISEKLVKLDYMKQERVFTKDVKFTQPCAISNSSLTWLNALEMIICRQR